VYPPAATEVRSGCGQRRKRILRRGQFGTTLRAESTARTAPFARGRDTVVNRAQRDLVERRGGDRLTRFSSSPST
jgi:hypothetical protein